MPKFIQEQFRSVFNGRENRSYFDHVDETDCEPIVDVQEVRDAPEHQKQTGHGKRCGCVHLQTIGAHNNLPRGVRSATKMERALLRPKPTSPAQQKKNPRVQLCGSG